MRPALALLLLMLLPPTATAQLPADLQLIEIQSGFSGITGIRAPHDGSQRLFILEQGGAIRIRTPSVLLSDPFLRLCVSAGTGCFVPPGGFSTGGEQGLLGLAFHPNYPSDRRVFLSYTNSAGHSRIATVLVMTGNPNRADTSTFQTLLQVDQDFGNHNGGDIHFGPDGFLYIGMGDGGAGNDPCSRSQTLRPADLIINVSCGSSVSRALLGKMLRIDVNNSTPVGSNNLCAANLDGSAPYALAPNNPFAGDGTGICGEIWSIGLRNPWRFSFDRLTGEMLIGDVGESAREEINLEQPGDGGRNYGWRCREGTLVNNTSAPYCNNATLVATFVPPIMEYSRSGGRCSITGGYRYRGPAPSLDGLYFFGDFCQGQVLVGEELVGSWSFVSWTSTFGNIRTFGEDQQGRVYVGTGSTVFLITGDLPDLIFGNGFEQ